MIYVTVTRPEDREVYVNGVYEEVAATIPHTFMLPAGSHKFETLIEGRLVDHRGEVTDMRDGTRDTIELSPVIPPEPID